MSEFTTSVTVSKQIDKITNALNEIKRIIEIDKDISNDEVHMSKINLSQDIKSVSLGAIGLLTQLALYIDGEYNIVKINDELPTIETLVDLMNVDEKWINRLLDELHMAKMISKSIRILGAERRLNIYINPIHFYSSDFIHPDVIDMFM